MISTEIFKERLRSSLGEHFPAAEIKVLPASETPKHAEALVIRFSDRCAGILIYPEEYISCMAAGVPEKELFDSILESVSALRGMDTGGLKKNISDPDRLFIVPANPAADLSDTPHFTVPGTDIRMTARCTVAAFPADRAYSYLVRREHLALFDMEEAALLAKAVENTLRTEEFQCIPLSEKLADISSVFEDPENASPAGSGLWVITSRSGLFGASAIAFPEVLRTSREKIGEDYYILPSSRHELLALGVSAAAARMTGEQLKELVACVNAEHVEEKDRLSYSVFLFDGEKVTAV